MKTTVEISDALFMAAKRQAAETGISLRAVIESGLRKELAPHGGRSKRPTRNRRLATVPSRLPPGLDVCDRGTIYDWLLKSR